MKTTILNKLSLFFLFLVTSFGFSQNTLQYNDEKGSQKATLQDVKWLQGNWKGTSSFGICEENWSEASAGTMLFSFKMISDNKVSFYEIGHIIEKEKTLLLQIRHFSSDLKPWEENAPETFKFIKIEDNKLYFDSLTYEKVGENMMNVYVYLEDSKEEIKFSFTK